MARTNKYASLNFNEIYEKKIINPNNKHPSSSSPSSSPSSSFASSPGKTIISNSRIHGSMLVLSRPSPKPIIVQPSPSPPPPSHQQQHQSPIPDQTRLEEDSISLRPLGRTGAGPSISSSPLTSPTPSPKPHRFVPPHLRPGFAGREERLQPEFQKQPGVRSKEVIGGLRQGQFGSPNPFGEEGRPKSGGGYERMRRIGEADIVDNGRHRPGSSGSRPNSSG